MNGLRTGSIVLVTALLAAVTLPVTTAAQAPAVPRLPAPITVKVGGAKGSLSGAGIYVGVHKGYFQESGITVEFVPLPSFNQLLPPLATGELDLASAGPSAALFSAVERGVKLRIVADQNTAFPGRASIGLMVRKDLIDSGQVKTFADLKGRTFALAARRASLELDLLKVLKMGGLTINDIKLVTMPFPQMNAAFGGKTIDACFQLEPLVTAAVTRGLAVRFKGHDEITPNRQNGFLVMSEHFAAKRDAARAFMVAYLRGVRDYNDAVLKGQGRDTIIQALMQFTTVQDRATYDRMTWPGIHPDGELNVDSIREALGEFRAAGDVKTDINLDQVIDMSFMRHAQQIVGPSRR